MLAQASRLLCFVALVAGAAAAQEDVVPETGGAGRLGAWEEHLALEHSSPFAELEWQALGPKFQGGRIECIDSPTGEPSVLYVGVGAGGIWKSENGGLAWRPIFAHESTMAIGDLTIAPSDPNVIWVGTGEAHLSGTSYPGTGVFRSGDAGDTWVNMGLVDTDHIGQVVVHPTDPDHVYVAAIGPKNGAEGERGVYETRDGGANWNRVLYAGEGVALIDLVMDPTDPLRLFAAAWDRGAGGRSGVFRSLDGGATWKRLSGGKLDGEQIGRVAVALAPSDPSVVYALLVDHSPPGRGRGGVTGVLMRSEDGGEFVVRTHEGKLPTYVGWDFCDVRVSPDDPDEVYVCGFRLLVSRDGGKSFERGGEDVQRLHPHPGRGMHLDMHDIWIDPANPDRVLIGNDGGLYISWDRARSWLHLNELPIAEFYTVTLDDGDPFQIYGGTQDNASLVGPSTARHTGGENDPWEPIFLDRWSGGDGFATFPDPSEEGAVYYEHQLGDMRRKRPGDSLGGAKRITPRAAEGEERLRFAWSAPLLPSFHQPQTIYCAAQNVFRSTNRGESWTSISPDLTGGRGSILSLSESPLDAARLVAGSGRGRIQLTLDGGESWTSAGDGLSEHTVRDVLASGHEANTVYVALSGAGSGDHHPHLFRSTDFGATWNSISKGLPPEPVNVLVEDPTDPQLLYVGTDLGVYASLDGGAQWVSLCASLPTAAVVDLAVHSREPTLVAVTHGLSAFLLDVSSLR